MKSSPWDSISTGRKRKVNWLNLDKLIIAINMSGTTDLIISKVDVLERLKIFKAYYNNMIIAFDNIDEMKRFIKHSISNNCLYIQNIQFSDNPYNIN